MMNYIWAGMIVLAFIAAAFQGRMAETSQAIISGGNSAVELCLKLLGMMCLWSGLMKIADKSGLTQKISKLLSPFMRMIFPTIDRNSDTAKAISMNITANLLGLGNAATPLGIQAMRCMQRDNTNPLMANDNMINFVVLNTAALHIIPTTVAMLRLQYGAANPMDIMPSAWISSLCTLTMGLIMVRLLKKVSKYDKY